MNWQLWFNKELNELAAISKNRIVGYEADAPLLKGWRPKRKSGWVKIGNFKGVI